MRGEGRALNQGKQDVHTGTEPWGRRGGGGLSARSAEWPLGNRAGGTRRSRSVTCCSSQWVMRCWICLDLYLDFKHYLCLW